METAIKKLLATWKHFEHHNSWYAEKKTSLREGFFSAIGNQSSVKCLYIFGKDDSFIFYDGTIVFVCFTTTVTQQDHYQTTNSPIYHDDNTFFEAGSINGKKGLSHHKKTVGGTEEWDFANDLQLNPSFFFFFFGGGGFCPFTFNFAVCLWISHLKKAGIFCFQKMYILRGGGETRIWVLDY